MAQKRMFSLTIVDTDAFLEMPMSTQLLYFHLSMRADDEGFVGNPKKILRFIGCQSDDLKVLIAKRFILSFDSGVVVIKHWLVHNTIRTDRIKKTTYSKEKETLTLNEFSAYTEACQPNVNQVSTKSQHRLDKIRLDKNRLVSETSSQTSHFTIPLIEEVKEYCLERKNDVDAERFVDFYSAKGWMIGKNKMRDWKSAVRTWEKKDTSKDTLKTNDRIL